eukprot:6554022-Pyramimonas_sp.AAC.1
MNRAPLRSSSSGGCLGRRGLLGEFWDALRERSATLRNGCVLSSSYNPVRDRDIRADASCPRPVTPSETGI